ncbi:OFA family MFS transporter [Demequina sp.]|uniref:OFA family MFS transporter n=1 Tax=Demequina sp. TaxID=2050685 RepID=UPI003D109353
MSLLAPARAVAPAGYNRWLVPPAALALHLAIGQVYAFSVFKAPLQEHFSVSHTAIGWVFSLAIAVLGLTAAFGGPWIAKQGPRKAMVLAAGFWVSGYLITGLAVTLDQLWLVYVGYGLIGGIGLGIGYVAPVATLVAWFPDRPGLATGMAVMGFGGGAMLASPLATALMGALTGPTGGLGFAFIVLGLMNAVLMLWAAAVIRVPATDGAAVDAHGDPIGAGTDADVTAGVAARKPVFWLLWLVFFVNITAGIGILETASPMIQAFFPATTVAAAAGFVGLLSLANMGGRFGWSALSDTIGRPATFTIFVVGGCTVYALLASVGSAAIALFVVLAFVQISFYGGGFSAMPAYLKDLFGQRHLSVILGLILTAWSAAGVVGPLIVNGIVDSREAAGFEGSDLYRPAQWIIAGLLLLAVIANVLVTLWGRSLRAAQRAAAGKPSDAAATVDAQPSGASGRVGKGALVPIGLWVVVGVALTYGIVETVIKAEQLFS